MPDPFPIRLWPDRAPLATGDAEVDVPQLIFHTPEDSRGGCVLICPGGGYGALAEHEGKTIGEYLAARGISGAVLRYRIAPNYQHPAPLLDVTRAMRTLRHRSGELRIDPHKIAVMGFSAGGHLASTLSTHFDAGVANAADPIDRENGRPDASILCYPVITFRPPFAHPGSRENLLRERAADDAMIALLSNDEQVTDKTPPAFLFHTVDDGLVPVENAMLYASALRKHGVPFAMHLYEHGHHGLGLASDDPVVSTWAGLLIDWLKARGW